MSVQKQMRRLHYQTQPLFCSSTLSMGHCSLLHILVQIPRVLTLCTQGFVTALLSFIDRLLLLPNEEALFFENILMMNFDFLLFFIPLY